MIVYKYTTLKQYATQVSIFSIYIASLLMPYTYQQPLPSSPISTQSCSTLGYTTALGVVSVLLVISLVGNATALLMFAVLRLSRKETNAVK